MATATLESAADEAAAAPAGGNISADDLLSKMAGAEIDRLLNEADAEHSPAKPAAPQPMATAAAEDTALAAQLDDLIDGAQPEKAAALTPAPAPAVATSAAPADAAEQERLKVLASELEVDTPAAAAAPVPAPAAEPAIAVSAETPAAESKPEPIPLLIRPLIWINAPLFFLPERARSVLGKAAVLTLINASALLVYVALFRHAK